MQGGKPGTMHISLSFSNVEIFIDCSSSNTHGLNLDDWIDPN